ncbi:MAG TPA: hypothetical protein VHC67_15880 [Gaiellaceae bacterium]|nr:hypothetical protein [Gaiellaceae bacterium]
MLTVLQQKLAEAHGLAISASVVTHKVAERIVDPTLLGELERMREEADETRVRCVLLERSLPEFDELRAHANSTHETGADLVGAWFNAGTDPLRAWTFLAMGEAAEVAAWSAVATLAAQAGDGPVAELSAWALPVQKQHLQAALDGAVVLAASLEPAAPRWG